MSKGKGVIQDGYARWVFDEVCGKGFWVLGYGFCLAHLI